MRYRLYNDELFHHGVLGQKWGIRRFQNPDGTLTPAGRKRYQKFVNKHANKGTSRVELGLTDERTIPAGTKMYRTTATEKDPNQLHSVYVSYTDVDRNHYRGGWIRQTGKTNEAYEHTYTLKKDLKIPSRELQSEIQNKVLMKNKDNMYSVAHSYVSMLYPKNSSRREYVNKFYEGGVKKVVDDIVDGYGNRTPDSLALTVSQSFGLAPKIKSEVTKELHKLGYNAMADEASIGGRNSWSKEGYDPLIIFDKSVLNEESISKPIRGYKESNYYQQDREWISKVNKQKDKAW